MSDVVQIPLLAAAPPIKALVAAQTTPVNLPRVPATVISHKKAHKAQTIEVSNEVLLCLLCFFVAPAGKRHLTPATNCQVSCRSSPKRKISTEKDLFSHHFPKIAGGIP